MRDIKFRALIKESIYDEKGNDKEVSFYLYDVAVYIGGEVGANFDNVYHQLNEQGFNQEQINHIIECNTNGDEWCLFNVECIEQYTGLKDKNCKDVYEGDILRDWEGCVVKVEFDIEDCKFITTDGKSSIQSIDFRSVVECEVIGNIHENPELLDN